MVFQRICRSNLYSTSWPDHPQEVPPASFSTGLLEVHPYVIYSAFALLASLSGSSLQKAKLGEFSHVIPCVYIAEQ